MAIGAAKVTGPRAERRRHYMVAALSWEAIPMLLCDDKERATVAWPAVRLDEERASRSWGLRVLTRPDRFKQRVMSLLLNHRAVRRAT